MANTKSAKKAILTTRRNRARNLAYKTRMKTAIKVCLDAIETNASDKEEKLRTALRIIDKTASKNVIKKTTAARKKSKLSSAFNKGTSAPAKKTATKKTTSQATKKKTSPAAKKTTAAKTKSKSSSAKKIDTKPAETESTEKNAADVNETVPSEKE